MTTTPPPPPPPGYGDDPKAHAAAAKAYAKAQRPWWKKKRFIIPIILVVLIIAASAGGSSDSGDDDTASGDDGTPSGIETNSGNEENAPPDDIDDGWKCEVDSLGQVQATGTLTNHSSETSSYSITVSFNEKGTNTRFGDGTAFVNSVRAGEKATWEAITFDEPPAAGFTCEITEVDRYAS